MIPSSVCTWTQRTLGNSSRLMVSMAVIFIVGLDGSAGGGLVALFYTAMPADADAIGPARSLAMGTSCDTFLPSCWRTHNKGKEISRVIGPEAAQPDGAPGDRSADVHRLQSRSGDRAMPKWGNRFFPGTQCPSGGSAGDLDRADPDRSGADPSRA